MHAAAEMGPRPRRRPKTWKIVVLSIVGLALLEPVVMYTLLQRQKAYRESLRSPTELVVTKSAGK
jgi:hypothetical protein